MQVGKAVVCVLDLLLCNVSRITIELFGEKEKNRPNNLIYTFEIRHSKSFQLFEISFSIVENSIRSPGNSLAFLFLVCKYCGKVLVETGFEV